jgi:hypothetical protein
MQGWSAGVVNICWGSRAASNRRTEGEGGVLTGGLRLPFFLQCQAHRTNRKEIFEDLWMHREISSRSLPPLGRFAREIREREGED